MLISQIIRSGVLKDSSGRVSWAIAAILGFGALGAFTPLSSSSNAVERHFTHAQAASPGPVSAEFFGMTINHLDSTPWPRISFRSIRSWDTGNVWSNINPAPGVFDWEQLDSLLSLSKAHGVDPVFVLGSTPRWASSKPEAQTPYGPGLCAPPVDLKYWDEFVRAIALHARNRIRSWEIWNEPQDPQFYCGDIATMSELQRRAYKIIKALDPTAIVLTPSPVGRAGFQWMSNFLATGAGDYADVMAFHGYWDTTPESIKLVIETYKQIFAAGGQGMKPVWDTEASWGSNSQLPDADEQAAFLAKYYLLHWSGGVNRFFWYSYDNVLFGWLWDSTNGLHKAGIAYREIQNWMVNASMVKPCSELGGIWSCDFNRSNGYMAKAIWRSVGETKYRPSDQYRQYRDLDGNTRQLRGALQIAGKPLLLENMTNF